MYVFQVYNVKQQLMNVSAILAKGKALKRALTSITNTSASASQDMSESTARLVS